MTVTAVVRRAGHGPDSARHHRGRRRAGGQHHHDRGRPERSCRAIPHHLRRALREAHGAAESVDGVHGQAVDVQAPRRRQQRLAIGEQIVPSSTLTRPEPTITAHMAPPASS